MMAALAGGCALRDAVPDDPATWGGKKEVWVFVAPMNELTTACRGNVLPATVEKAAADAGVRVPRTHFESVDVLVSQEQLDKPVKDKDEVRLPYSCVDREVFEHRSTHGKHPKTTIKLSQFWQNYVLFRSLAPFKILAVDDRVTKKQFPFFRKVLDPPTTEAVQHQTGPMDRTVKVGGGHVKYKVVFEIRGVKIDPDIECKFKG